MMPGISEVRGPAHTQQGAFVLFISASVGAFCEHSCKCATASGGVDPAITINNNISVFRSVALMERIEHLQL